MNWKVISAVVAVAVGAALLGLLIECPPGEVVELVEVPCVDLHVVESGDEALCSIPLDSWQVIDELNSQGATYSNFYPFKPIRSSYTLDAMRPSQLALLGGLTPGSNKTVADVGTGGGYIAFHLAPYAEKVYAEDLDPNMLRSVKAWQRALPSLQEHPLPRVRSRVSNTRHDNIETVLGTLTDVNISPETVDAFYLSDVYHCFCGANDEPSPLLRSIWTATRHGGRVVVIDSPKRFEFSETMMMTQFEQSGFGLEVRHCTTNLDRCVFVFTKTDADRRDLESP